MADSTWTGAASDEFTTAANWSPNGVPTGSAIFEANGAPTSIKVSTTTTLGALQFNAGAPAYSFTIQSVDFSNTHLDFTGAGIVDDSSNAPTFTILGGSQGSESMYFDNSASAGDATILLPATQLSSNTFANGLLIFRGDSSAGNATIAAGTFGGEVEFEDASSAGSAKISVAGEDMGFSGTSTAANANITNTGITNLSFADDASAGDAVIDDNTGSYGAGDFFYDDATAASATINVSTGSELQFFDSSTAANATLNVGDNAILYFNGESTGGLATLDNDSLVEFYSSGLSGNDQVSIGSIAGSGSIGIGGPGDTQTNEQLTVGGNNLSTTYTGEIYGNEHLTGGSLVKVGTGTLTLDGDNAYTGITDVQDGALIVGDFTHTSASLAGDAQVESGAVLYMYNNVSGSNTLTIESGGRLELGGSDSEEIVFAGAGATLAFFHPGATNTEKLDGVAPGDTVELPGSSVVSVTFTSNGLTATTNAGTYAFSDVTYGSSVGAYSWGVDPATGLVAIHLEAPTTYNWINGSGGNWNVGANWSSGLVPRSANDAYITISGPTPYVAAVTDTEAAHSLTLDSPDGTLQIDNGGDLSISGALTIDDETANKAGAEVQSGGALSVGSLSVGEASGSSGFVTVDAGGAMIVSGAADFGVATGGSGALTVTGAGAKLTVGDDLTIGDDGVGTMFVTDGGSVTTSGFGEVGAGGGAAAVTVDGAGSKWTISDELILGVVGSASGPTMTISNGAVVESEKEYAANDEVIDDRNRSGSTLSITSGGELDDIVFYNENNAALSLSDGAKLNLSGIDATDYGESNLFANGTVTIDDAMVLSPAGAIAIGSNAGGEDGAGTVTVSNGATVTALITRLGWNAASSPPSTLSGSLTLTGVGTTWSDVATAGGPSDAGSSYVGAYGSGTLTIENGAAMNEAGAAELGYATSGNGVATVDGAGSSWTIVSFLNVGRGGSGSLTVSAGGAVSADAAFLGYYGGSTGTLDVNAGGSVTIATEMYVGLSANSTGALTVNGAGASFTVGDELYLGANGKGTLTIEAGAALNDADGADLGFGAVASGTATVEGAGSTWTITDELIVGAQGVGQLTIEDGGKISAGSASVGDFAGSSGTFNVDAGGVVTIAGELDIGEASGSVGNMTVAGAGATVTAADLMVKFGSLTIGVGGTVNATNYTVLPGASLNMQGGTLDPITIDANGDISGYGVIVGELTNNGTVTATGGALELQGAVSGAGQLIVDSGSTLQLDRDVAATQNIIFNGTGGTMALGAGAEISGPVSGLASGDTISILGETITGVTYDPTDGALTMSTSAGPTATLDLVGAHDQSEFTLVDGDVVVACFCAGTLILTAEGEGAVEDLAVGDRVATIHGGTRPIKWIGRRSYDGRFMVGQPLMLPVCIKRGAIEDHVPARDLWVSPGHAIYLDGVLVPSWLLVNGVSIAQTTSVDEVTYIHIELADHEVIFAEGCPAESFIDDNCRNQFQNAAEFHALYPNHELGRGHSCLPRVEDGFHLRAIQRRLASRAGVKISSEQSGPLRGYVDVASPRKVAGWAQSETHPEVPVCLDILVDGRRVMRALANRYRADLREAGMGSGKHSFEVRLPAGVSGRVEVRRSSDQACLALTEAAMALAA